MVDKLARASEALRVRAADLQNDSDRASYQQYFDLGNRFLQSGELQQAFREHCRAMRTVMEVFRRQKTRTEVFQPVWEN
jgi:hypothetical protein